MEKNCYSRIFGAKPKENIVKFYYAYELIVAGLRHYCGDSAEWLPEYDGIVDWLKDNQGKSLLMLGDSGRGKSLICRDIIPKIINSRGEGDKCGVITAYDLAIAGDEPFHRGYLMIDDIGVESDYSDYGIKRNIVREIVDRAEINNTCLILTSNMTISELSDKYGERTLDRLKALCTIVTTTGDSLRGTSTAVDGIPARHRSYGIDFKTKEEADAFRKEQDELYDGYLKAKYKCNPSDYNEIADGQPLKLCDGVLYALLKYDWDKQQ